MLAMEARMAWGAPITANTPSPRGLGWAPWCRTSRGQLALTLSDTPLRRALQGLSGGAVPLAVGTRRGTESTDIAFCQRAHPPKATPAPNPAFRQPTTLLPSLAAREGLVLPLPRPHHCDNGCLRSTAALGHPPPPQSPLARPPAIGTCHLRLPSLLRPVPPAHPPARALTAGSSAPQYGLAAAVLVPSSHHRRALLRLIHSAASAGGLSAPR
ncbi:hypothetical protein B0H14DRAFT_3455792 [Mycena olivaceomarginata]|nr:hypothetical protein B0H14DRAFT_3455792 [Mycena olivaceomarginata]